MRQANPPAGERAPLDAALLKSAAAGLGLQAEPFAALGEAFGIGGEAVIERLRRLTRHGVIGGVGLLWAPGFAGASSADDRDDCQALRDATACGLPLVARPYEALAAMLGWPVDRVPAVLSAALARGEILRIAILPPQPC